MKYTIKQQLIRYREPLSYGALAFYSFCFAIFDVIGTTHSISWGLIMLALTFYYIGKIDDTIKSRYKIEETAMRIKDKLDEHLANGYEMEANEYRGMLTVRPRLSDYILDIALFVGGSVIALTSWPNILPLLAGAVLSIVSLVCVYAARQEDHLIQ